LARRIANGDELAFSVLYQRYRVRIERYCRSIVRHDEDALDAAQNTLVKALIAIRDGRQAPTIVPWLFHIARNEAITVLRGRRSQSELVETLPDPRHGPAGEAMMREELRATIDSVRALSDRSRDALILREVAGLRYDQVGQALDVTPGAARQAVHEARRALAADRMGRDEDCAVIRAALGDRDGRRRSTRTVRAHLRGCGACREWQADTTRISGRRFAALPGQVSVGGLPSWLAGLFGTGATGGAVLTGSVGINIKVLTSLAVLAVGVAPATEREIARPVVAPRHEAAAAAKPAATNPAAAKPAVAHPAATRAASPIAAPRHATTTRERGARAPIGAPQRRSTPGEHAPHDRQQPTERQQTAPPRPASPPPAQARAEHEPQLQPVRQPQQAPPVAMPQGTS
jgi:RNA polymerase sigma factor (sigma-70 family)